MRGMREGGASSRGLLSAGKVESTIAGSGGGGGSSRKLKVFQSKKESKRRLILSDSESEDHPVSTRPQKAVAWAESVDLKGNGSGSRKREFEGFPKNGKRTGIPVQKDVVKCRQDGNMDLKSAMRLGMERKRSWEASQNGVEDDGVALKKTKLKSSKCGNDKSGEMDVEGMRLDSVRSGVGKALIRISNLPGQKQVMAADEGSSSLAKKRMHAHLKGNRSLEDGNSNCSEYSSQKMHGLLKHNMSPSNVQQYSASSDGKSFRFQGKGGVLRLLPGNRKSAGQNVLNVEGESHGSIKISGSSGGAYNRSWSEGRKSLKKPHSSSISNASGMNLQCSGGDDQCTRHPSLFGDGKSLRRAGYSSVTEEARKSPGHSNYSDQTILKHLSLFKDGRALKKRDSSTKEENRKSPIYSAGAVQVTLKHSSSSEEGMYLKKSESSLSLDSRKSPERSSCTATLSEDRKSLKNPGASSIRRKRHVKLRGKVLELKNKADRVCPQTDSKSAKSLRKKTEVKERGASRFITKTTLSAENNMMTETVSRSTEKQKLRDHIKGMLLSAGWNIDMRPRRGRNYEDAVYVSPQGTGYWSITKAYSVFQEQLNKKGEMGDVNIKEMHCPPSNAFSTNAYDHNGIASQFSAIPLEMLAMLRRKVVQKRRRRIEERDNGKHAKSIKRKDKAAGVKKRTNENSVVGSSWKKNKNRRGCALLARTSNAEADSEDDGYVPYAGKRSILSWMIDSGTVPANGKVKYMNKRHTRTMLEGLITRDGIHCSCCSKVLTVSKFGVHAGSKLDEAYTNILVEDSGISLLQCQLNTWERQKESERCAFHLVDITDDDPNDDTCGICGDGGELICCDSCPSTFHQNCLGIQMLPPGDWQCTNCLCRFCGVTNSNTVEGDGVTYSSLLSCGQCEGKYHRACIPDVDVIPVGTDESSPSFCGQNCRMLFEHLQNRLGVKNDLDAGFSWTLVRRLDDESLTCSSVAQRAECNSKIAIALAVMNECFLRIIDRRSGINLVHNVVYNRGSNFSRLSYSGFYTFILERGDEVISAASIRFRGSRFAEMPFIGTRDIYRRQGMCRRLLNVIEATLQSLKIEKLVIPAISELMHTWTVVFGFKPLDDSDKQEVKSINMLVFPDTGLLQKPLLGSGSNRTKEGGLGPIENDKSTVPNGSAELCATDDGTLSCLADHRDEIGIERPGLPASNGSAHVTTELSYQPLDVPSDATCRSDSEALRYKPLETASDRRPSADHNMGCDDKPCGRSMLCAGSPIEHLPCDDGPGLDDAEVESRYNVTHPSIPAIDKLSIPHTSDVTEKSFDTSTLFQSVDNITLHTKSGYAGMLSEFRSKETHHNSSEVASESSSTPVLCNPLALDVATVLDTHIKKGGTTAFADNPLNCDSHQIPEAARVSEEATVDMPSTESFEPILHRVDDALHDTGKGVEEIDAIKHNICAFHKDPHPCTSEAFASQIEGVHQGNACEGVVCEVSEITNCHNCSQSDNDLQVSEHYLYQGSELPLGSTEISCDVALLSAPKASIKYDGDNTT